MGARVTPRAIYCVALLPGVPIMLLAAHTITVTTPAAAEQVEIVGNPSALRYDATRIYPRNIWDMQVFDGRLYVGTGNSSNYGPSSNAGPVDVWSYDPKTSQFSSEFVVDEEQIARFRVADGALLIPGHDPHGSDRYGDFYRLRDGKWEKVQTIPYGMHTYDIIPFQGALFVAVSTPEGAYVDRSTDDGKSWETRLLLRANSARALFTLNDRLYASMYMNPLLGTARRLDVWDHDHFQPITAEMFPDSQHSIDALVERAINFRDSLVYVGADAVNDHQWIPFGLFTASTIDQAKKVPLPAGEIPYDIVVDHETCYVLTDTAPREPADGGQHLVKVWASDDLLRWREVVRFPSPTFARSFEILEGDFYFGLGCQTSPLAPETGEILRVRKEFVN